MVYIILLQVGDELLEINGYSTEGMLHTDVVAISKQRGNKIALTVKRSSETISKLYMLLLNCWSVLILPLISGRG